jgi:siroheme synthase
MRRGLVLALVAGLAAAVAVPALAHLPVRTTVSQQATLTNPTACGSYGVEWRINLTAENTTYFDDQGAGRT